METFSPEHKTKLSSAGLIYKHYGQQLIQQEMKDTSDQTMLNILYKKLYENFVEALDAIDNGISQYDTDSNAKYSSRTDLSSRVSHVSWMSDKRTIIALAYARLLHSLTHHGTNLSMTLLLM